MRIPERREKGTKEIFEATMTENLPQVNLIHQNDRSRKLREHQPGKKLQV